MNFTKIILYIFAEYLLILRIHLKSFLYRNPPAKWLKGTKGDIILLQGFSETWLFLEKIGNTLSSAGYRIHVIGKLNHNRLSISKSSRIVEEYIQKHKLKNIIFISHSKGGIIAKYFIDHSIDNRLVKYSISIATPYKGSWLGYLKLLFLYELLPSSKILKGLKQENNYRFLNIYAKLDNHIIPSKNAILSGAKNVCINIVGHTRILEAMETIQEIQKFLDI